MLSTKYEYYKPGCYDIFPSSSLSFFTKVSCFFKLSNLSKLAQNSSLSKKFQLCINN